MIEAFDASTYSFKNAKINMYSLYLAYLDLIIQSKNSEVEQKSVLTNHEKLFPELNINSRSFYRYIEDLDKLHLAKKIKNGNSNQIQNIHSNFFFYLQRDDVLNKTVEVMQKMMNFRTNYIDTNRKEGFNQDILFPSGSLYSFYSTFAKNGVHIQNIGEVKYRVSTYYDKKIDDSSNDSNNHSIIFVIPFKTLSDLRFRQSYRKKLILYDLLNLSDVDEIINITVLGVELINLIHKYYFYTAALIQNQFLIDQSL